MSRAPSAGIDHVERRIKRWLRSGLDSRWVVAVSGGSDSVGLLRVLHYCATSLELKLSVAHLDHGTRGEESRRDAEFVASLAEQLGLPFDLGHWRPTRASHFEADARRARYAWLTEVARAREARVIAVGHTRDDQAETILHRIVRGTGLRGLAGMPDRRPLDESRTLVRPLLRVSRQGIRDHLKTLGQPYRDDASNADLSRTRARIRHDLMSRLASEYNPKVTEALLRLGQIAREAEHVGHDHVQALLQTVEWSNGGDEIRIGREALRALPPFLRTEVLRRAWRQAGWPEAGMGAARWQRLAALLRTSNGRFSLGEGIEAFAQSDALVLRRTSPREGGAPSEPLLSTRKRLGRSPALPKSGPIPPIPLDIPGSVPWNGGQIIAILDPDSPRDETVDLDRLVGRLHVGTPVPGDRFQPLGMGGRSTPLNDFLRNLRIPLVQRGGIPLVCDREGIVWVGGCRIADRIRLTDATCRRLGLRWIRDAGEGSSGASDPGTSE
jgi:tRNA(Ile)-lysidine synthase